MSARSHVDSDGRDRPQEVAADLGQRLLDADPDEFDRVLSEATATVAETLDAERGTIVRVLPGGDHAVVRASAGGEDAIDGATVPADDETAIGRALDSSGPVVVDDPDDEEGRSDDEPAAEGSAGSAVSVAFGPDDDPWGVLELRSESGRTFSEDDVAFVRTVATVLGLGVQNARIETRLEAEEGFKEQIAETSPIGITVVDENGEITFANERAAEIFGRSREQITSYSHADPRWDLVDADGNSLPEEEAPFARVMSTGEPVYDVEAGLRRPDGRRVWLSINGTPIRIAGTDATGAVFAFEDVTEEKRLEAELEEILGRVTDAFYAVDDEFRFTHVNERAEELLQRPESELLGENLWELYPEAADVEEVWNAFREAMETQEPTSYELYFEPLDFRVEANLYPSETGISVYFRDVTEQQRLQEELSETNRTLRRLYEISSDRERSFDDKVEHLLGLGRERLDLDVGFLATIDEDDDRFEVVAADGNDDRLEPGSVTRLSETYCRRTIDSDGLLGLTDVPNEGPIDGRTHETWDFDCYLGGKVLVDGDLYGTLCFADRSPRQSSFTAAERSFVELITQWVSYELEREKRERELAASNERLEQFAYAASHDMQEPLRMVSSYLQLLDRRYGDELDDDGEEFLEYAVDGAERMRSMIDGLLEYSRVETRGKPLEPTDLNEVLEDVRTDLRIQIDERDAEINIEALPRVEGDPDQLRQVFQNLLENAIAYAGDDPPRVTVTAEREGSTAAIAVRDEGIGIDPADQERIFEVFQRLHGVDEQPGTGIGLALTKRILDRHGGEIRVDSEPGEGSTFTVVLPRSTDADE